MDAAKESLLQALKEAETAKLIAETAKLQAEIAKLNAELQLAKVKAAWNPILSAALILFAVTAFGLSVFTSVSQ